MQQEVEEITKVQKAPEFEIIENRQKDVLEYAMENQRLSKQI